MRLIKHPLLWVWLALAGVLLLAISMPDRGVTMLSQLETKRESQNARQQRATTEPDGATTSPKNQLSAREYEPDCGDPNKADLCAQLRMARAAEDQIGLNWLGIALLFGTLLFTGSAAVSARSAAESAHQNRQGNERYRGAPAPGLRLPA